MSMTDARWGAAREIARVAHEVNATVENIGARRLHTVLPQLCPASSFLILQHCSQERDWWPCLRVRG